MAQLGPGMAGCERICCYPEIDVSLVPPKGTKNLHQAARTARMNGHYGAMIGWYLKYFGAKL